MHPLVSVDWLNQNQHNPDLILLDASLPGTVEGKSADTGQATIPGARFFDLKKKFSDLNAPFPNTIPSPTQFEKECRDLGVNNHSTIIVFDNMGIYSSPRVWWLFKTMRHQKVFVLDGGLPEWIKAGLSTTTTHAISETSGDLIANYRSEFLKTFEDVVNNCEHPHFKLIDARSAGRFSGEQSEPRKHLKSGHIPGSVNLPFGEVLENGKFKSKEDLDAIFQNLVGNEQNLAFSCGSGLTACIILLAAHLTGRESKLLYDGSWTEWAERKRLITT
ncbi:MAG: sulfurtransferase [Cytophagales bacterium]|nr:sulfurtransferase [Cytophagales bacterium]